MQTTDTLFKALSDPARLRIVRFLARPDAIVGGRDDDVCACDIEAMLGLSQPTVSHHMKLLVQAGLVCARKEGRWVHYRLDRARLHALADAVRALADTPDADESGSPAHPADSLAA